MVTSLFSCTDESKVTIRGWRLCLTSRKAGQVVPVDVAFYEPPTKMRWMREGPVYGYQSYQNNENTIHRQPPWKTDFLKRGEDHVMFYHMLYSALTFCN